MKFLYKLAMVNSTLQRKMKVFTIQLFQGLSYKFIIIMCCIFFSATIAGAAGENADNMRSIYDVVMRWVNFLILAGIIVKYGKAPLKKFLFSQKEEVALKINTLEEDKKEALGKINEIKATINDSQALIQKIKERIITQGEREKEKTIQDARYQSEAILISTQKKIDHLLIEAQQTLKTELLDSAIDMAVTKLPEYINADDNEMFLNKYLDTTQSLKAFA